MGNWASYFEPALRREQEWRCAVQEMARQPGVVFDLGGGTPHQGYISSGDVGPQTQYICLDISLEAVPHIVADVTCLPLASSSIDAILCNAVLEHVSEPKSAVDEMHRVLKEKGHVMASVPFIYPYHDRVDFFRFTDTALEHMFRQFKETEIVAVGDYVYTVFMFVTGFNFGIVKWLSPLLGITRSIIRLFFSLHNRLAPSPKTRDYQKSLTKSPLGWYVYCRK